jgi:hypothetical protein
LEEVHSATPYEDAEAAISREVLRRMSDEQLEDYEVALERVIEDEELTRADREILHHADSLYEEVRGWG